MLKIFKPKEEDKKFHLLVIPPEITGEDFKWALKTWARDKTNYIVTDAPLEVASIKQN